MWPQPRGLLGALLLLLLHLSCNAQAGQGQGHGQGGDAHCSWLSPQTCGPSVTTPVLGLVFLHMRKSGGTHILHFLSEWLRSHGCFDGMVKKTDIEGVENMNGGRISHRKFQTLEYAYREGHSTCPYIDIYHNEYRCLSGDVVLGFPSAEQLRNNLHTNFKMLTVLRDPIERIGSQFLHTPECYGRRHVLQTVERLCGTRKWLGHCRSDESRGGARSELCKCIYNTTALAFENLKQNESVWFDWFLRSEQGFLEQHVDNYYVKRLGSVPVIKDRPRYYNMIENQKCMKQPSNCSMKPDVFMLQKMSSFHECIGKPPTEKRYTDQEALATSKELLKDHFYFLIMEYFQDMDSNKRILSALLNDESVAGMVEQGKWSRDQKASRGGQLQIFNKVKQTPPHIARGAAVSKKHIWQTAKNLKEAYFSAPSSRLSASLNVNLEIGEYQKLMPASVVEYVMKHNQEDYELYHFARRLYRERYSTDYTVRGSSSSADKSK
jgi:hypothetical protein